MCDSLNNVYKSQCYYTDCKLRKGKDCLSFFTHHFLLNTGQRGSVCWSIFVIDAELNDCLMPYDAPVVRCSVHAAWAPQRSLLLVRLRMTLSMCVCSPQRLSSCIQGLDGQVSSLQLVVGAWDTWRPTGCSTAGWFLHKACKVSCQSGRKGFLGTWPGLPVSRFHFRQPSFAPPHLPTAVSFPKWSPRLENVIGGMAGCNSQSGR